ncbi:hypothetical protein NGM99_15435 [Mesorhizobium sp. RP14(2022)]|uniref:Intersectin-EH binding protein Ibp1 n=1 Tax=Mesorhizobium liriopis TaxID=2953882 RepID=A0ABT1C8K9_9HYPH|nr:hypothetical protein [Mesorhizobium liriopis]MCO6051177.1 hypothetical protein [Mesorhizobium liriopis]
MMTRTFTLPALALGASLVFGSSAFAQAPSDPPAGPGSTTEDCQASNSDNPVDNGTTQTPSTNLTQTLNNCGSVLQPPPTGDSGVTQPIPDTGEMPVVPPSAVPAQPAQPQAQ